MLEVRGEGGTVSPSLTTKIAISKEVGGNSQKSGLFMWSGGNSLAGRRAVRGRGGR